MVAQAQDRHRCEGHLLGPGAAGRVGRYQHPEREFADAVLATGRGGYSAVAAPVQPEPFSVPSPLPDPHPASIVATIEEASNTVTNFFFILNPPKRFNIKIVFANILGCFR